MEKLEAENIPPGESVMMNFPLSKTHRNKLRDIRNALAYKRRDDVQLTEAYQLAMELGIKQLDKILLQPTEV